MAKLSEQCGKISQNYIFPIVHEKMKAFQKAHPDISLLNMGIGDVSMPLAPSIVQGIKDAADEMGSSIHGYGPAEGYSFLRNRIFEVEYHEYNISADEIFISSGINESICAFSELFSLSSSVGILDPTYPVYLETNILAGREKIIKIPCTEENAFMPSPPDQKIDIVYLTTPNNPTGVAFTREKLQQWVNWAIHHESILLIDAAYRAFIHSDDHARSIYEIEGADQVAIEFCSFSKVAGFTGLRVGYTIVPKKVQGALQEKSASFHHYWTVTQNTKSNGVSYVMQKGALAALSKEGLRETMKQVEIYSKSTQSIRKVLQDQGQTCFGGLYCAYVWWKIPFGSDWEFFDFLLEKLHIVGVPGCGFGEMGNGFIRLSGFQTEVTVAKATGQLSLLKEVSHEV